jgi:hypothetical protein
LLLLPAAAASSTLADHVRVCRCVDKARKKSNVHRRGSADEARKQVSILTVAVREPSCRCCCGQDRVHGIERARASLCQLASC